MASQRGKAAQEGKGQITSKDAHRAQRRVCSRNRPSNTKGVGQLDRPPTSSPLVECKYLLALKKREKKKKYPKKGDRGPIAVKEPTEGLKERMGSFLPHWACLGHQMQDSLVRGSPIG